MSYKKIIVKIDEETKAVEIIRNHENPNECNVVINDRFFSCPNETEYSFELLTAIKTVVPEEAIVIMFNDNELPEAWKQSYQKAGILEKYPDDRRLKFHPYNEMNEMFCIDQSLLWDITDEFKGTDHELTEEKCKWRFEIIKWYKNHLI